MGHCHDSNEKLISRQGFDFAQVVMVIGLLAHIILAALLLPSIIHQQPGKVGITNWELLILGVTGEVLRLFLFLSIPT